jgi:hypothetical protein
VSFDEEEVARFEKEAMAMMLDAKAAARRQAAAVTAGERRVAEVEASACLTVEVGEQQRQGEGVTTLMRSRVLPAPALTPIGCQVEEEQPLQGKEKQQRVGMLQAPEEQRLQGKEERRVAGQQEVQARQEGACYSPNARRRMVSEFLESHGFKKDGVNQRKKSILKFQYPLHVAVKEQNVDMVKLLLESGADKSVKNSSGWTPLDKAAQYKNKMTQGSSVQSSRGTPYKTSVSVLQALGGC